MSKTDDIPLNTGDREQTSDGSATAVAIAGRAWPIPWVSMRFQLREFTLIGILILMVVVYAIAAPNFLTVFNLVNVLRQVSVTAVAAVGATAVILVAGIDLSVSSMVALTGCLAALYLQNQPNHGPEQALVAVLLAIVFGTGAGLFNGLAITGLRVPPFITTLATMTILRGVALLLTNAYPVSIPPGAYNYIGVGYIGPVPVPVLIMLLMFAIGWVILNRMTIGRRIYAIGGNERAARLSGINVSRVLLFVYAFAGFCAGVSGVIISSRLTSGQPTGSLGFELDVIAAVVVGGTSLSGGRGKLSGSLLGAVLIAILGNGLILMDVPEYYQRLVTGFVILLAVTADMLLRKRSV